MSWNPSEKEITSVLASDGRHRYEYFIHRTCEARAVWALYHEGWASVTQEDGQVLIPLWPHAAFANAFATGAWAGFEARRIELADFLQAWLPGLQKEAIQPAVFPVPTGSSVIVSVADLEEHLRHELAEVHGVEELE